MMGNSFRIIAAAVLLALALSLPAGTAWSADKPDLSVTVKTAAEVTGETIRLGDLAEITGPDCALKTDLLETPITQAPPPGHSTTVRKAYLAHRLRSSGLPLNLVRWRLVEKTEVTRRFQTIGDDWVRRVIEEHLAVTEPFKSNVWQVISLNTGSLPNLPLGQLEYHVSPNAASSPERLSLTIFLVVDGQEVDRVRVSGRVNLTVTAVVAARRLERGEDIIPGDLKIARISSTKAKPGTLTETDQADGFSIRRQIQAGEPITFSDLLPVDVVQKGDMVTIVAQSGQLRVTAPGQARRNGAVGELISVVNMSSKKVVSARVVDSRTVQVNF